MGARPGATKSNMDNSIGDIQTPNILIIKLGGYSDKSISKLVHVVLMDGLLSTSQFVSTCLCRIGNCPKAVSLDVQLVLYPMVMNPIR